MAHGGSISVQSVRGYLELARAQGLDVKALLDEIGGADLLDEFDGRVSWQTCEKIAASIASRIGIPNMVRTMLAFRGTGFGVLYHVARNSRTVGLALRRVAEYYHVTSTLGRCELVERDERGAARLVLTQHDYLSRAFRGLVSALWSISNVAVIRQLVGESFRPVSVHLELDRPADASELAAYQNALNCELAFGDASAVQIDVALLDQEVIGADPVLETAMVRYVDEITSRLPNVGIAGQVRRVVVAALRKGEPSVDTVARHLGTTSRTLQRRLRGEGTSFQQVVDEVRREVAVTHIRGRRATIDEVAFLLGFEKPSSFHRAFKRWTGVTPGEYRRHSA